MANNQNLKQFKKGNDKRRNLEGRPKKFITSLRAHGYKLSEINDCIKTMLSMTRAQLEQAKNTPEATALELMIVAAIETSIERGDLSVMETLLSRSFGKPKETVEVNPPPEIIAARSLYSQLIGERGYSRELAIKRIIEAAKLSGVELTEDDILDADNVG